MRWGFHKQESMNELCTIDNNIFKLNGRNTKGVNEGVYVVLFGMHMRAKYL